MGVVTVLHHAFGHEDGGLDGNVLKPEVVGLLNQRSQAGDGFLGVLFLNLYHRQVSLCNHDRDRFFAARGGLQRLRIRSVRGFEISAVEERIALESQCFRQHAVILQFAREAERLVQIAFRLVSASREDESFSR